MRALDNQDATADRGARDTVEIVVAIPVRNERDRIGDCLSALACQIGVAPSALGILLFLNNCTDDTRAVVDRWSCRLRWPLRVIECDSDAASAGWARRMAMEAAAAWLDEGGSDQGVLLTSDADSRVSEDWVAANIAAIRAGADAVAGRIALDPTEAALLPAHLHARGRLESQYEALLIEIGALIDPQPGNPWPHHWTRSGATLAVRASVYHAIGGMPEIPCGEDRAFVEAISARDLIVRYAPDIVVQTSGRLDGRAVGGVADTIKLRCDVFESPCDDRLESLFRSTARVCGRRYIRRLHANGHLRGSRGWAAVLGIPRSIVKEIARSHYFGETFAGIEKASPRFVYRPLRPSELRRQIRYANALIWVLRIVDRNRMSTSAVAPPALLTVIDRTLPVAP